MIEISQTIETDVLVVGAGIAGLSCAIEAKSQGLSPLLISKSQVGAGASYFPLKATLGIQVSGGVADYAYFQQDIERVAQGMANPKIIKAYVEESAQAIALLKRIGFKPWKRNDERPACFAKYSRPIFLINQWRDAANQARKILEEKAIAFYENATLLFIARAENQVQGAVFAVNISGEFRYIFCKTSQLILATGGIAGLYKNNLYPQDVIGSSHFLAKQAGAALTNLEFIQFIPAFVKPKYKVLFGEHTLKYVIKVTDSRGENLFSELSAQAFKQMMQERSSYAPFSVDFDCVRFDLRIMQHLLENPQEKGVYLHYSPALYEDKEEFYRVYLSWLEQDIGIHLCRDRVAIAPFAHSCNGGVVIDEFAQTAVKGLFAVGEVSSCIEGANRLGGNSVGGSLVFAKRAIRRILQNLSQERPLVCCSEMIKQAETYFASLDKPNGDRMLSASEVLKTVRELMAAFANVYRSEANLIMLLEELVLLETKFMPLVHHLHQGIEIYHSLKTAQLVVEAMLARKMSLGAHYRED